MAEEAVIANNLQTDDRKAYAINELAEQYGVSKELVRRHIKSGALRAWDLGTNGRPCWRIAADDWEAFLTSRRTGRSTEKKPRRKHGLPKPRKNRFVA